MKSEIPDESETKKGQIDVGKLRVSYPSADKLPSLLFIMQVKNGAVMEPAFIWDPEEDE